MDPILELGALRIPAYAIMLAIAGCAGTALATLRARRDDVSMRPFVVTSGAAFVAGLIGASLWSGVFESSRFFADVVGDNVGGGLSIFGGLLGGAAAALAIARLTGIGFRDYAEAAAPGAALGIGIGRVGCLLAGCCFGEPTLFPIAIVFRDYDAAARPLGVPLHATQVYESVGCALLSAALWWTPRGLRLPMLVLGYGIVRSSIEPLRADVRGTVAGLPPTTCAAAMSIVAGLIWIVVRHWAVRPAEKSARS